MVEASRLQSQTSFTKIEGSVWMRKLWRTLLLWNLLRKSWPNWNGHRQSRRRTEPRRCSLFRHLHPRQRCSHPAFSCWKGENWFRQRCVLVLRPPFKAQETQCFNLRCPHRYGLILESLYFFFFYINAMWMIQFFLDVLWQTSTRARIRKSRRRN